MEQTPHLVPCPYCGNASNLEPKYDTYNQDYPTEVEGESKISNDMPGIEKFITTTIKYLTSTRSIEYSM